MAAKEVGSAGTARWTTEGTGAEGRRAGAAGRRAGTARKEWRAGRRERTAEPAGAPGAARAKRRAGATEPAAQQQQNGQAGQQMEVQELDQSPVHSLEQELF